MSRVREFTDRPEPIAIIGLGALMPKAGSLAQFWINILEGVDCIEDVPASRWDAASYFSDDLHARDKTYCTRGGFLPDIPFDPLEYGVPPNTLGVTDAAQLLSLAVAKAAFADAGYPVLSGLDHSHTAAVLGVTGTSMKLLNALSARLDYPSWERALDEAGIDTPTAHRVIARLRESYPEWDENAFPGFLASLVPGRISNRFDLGGPSYAVDAACASSICAIRLACAELAVGDCDLALTGGVDTDNSITAFLSFSKTPALSPSQQVKPFDAAGDGTLISEGVGMLVLKRLADATAAGDRVYAVIRGIGVSTDGRGSAIYVPRADGQVRAIRSALRQAGVGAETIGLIEAHGTGTPVGDAVELDGLMKTYGAHIHTDAPIALGSVKSQIGHTKAAAGAASMIKAALALHHKVLPPTRVTTPHPTIAKQDSPFSLPRTARPWFSSDGAPRRAAVSAFGFGGANYHAVLEEFNAAGETRQGVLDRATISMNHAEGLGTTGSATDGVALRAAARVGESDGPHRHGGEPGRTVQAGLVAVFSGQGSQYVGMGSGLAIVHGAFRVAVEEMDRALTMVGEAPCSAVMFPPWPRQDREAASQRARLQQTLFAQSAVGAFSMGAFALLRDAGLRPACAIGHSFGELTALWAAGCFTDWEFTYLVAARGRSLSPAADIDPGSLLAVRAPLDQLQPILKAEPRLAVANLNGPEQIVVGGPSEVVDVAEERLVAAGIQAIRLPVAAAFHTPCVEYAREPWSHALSAVRPRPPNMTVMGNSNAECYPDHADGIIRLLAKQPFEPVRFHDQVEAAYAAGGRIFLEIGPKALIARLIDEILGSRPHETVAINPDPTGDANAQLTRAFERLNALGISLAHFHGRVEQNAGALTAGEQPLSHGVIMLGAGGPVRQHQQSGTRAIAALSAGDCPVTDHAPSTKGVHPLELAVPAPASAATYPTLAAGDDNFDPRATTLRQVQEMQAALAESHRLFLAGQTAIARALVDPGGVGDPAMLALLRDVQDSATSLHERYLQDQADIARAMLIGGSPAPTSSPIRLGSSREQAGTKETLPEPEPAPMDRAIVQAGTDSDISSRLRAAVASVTGYPIDFIDPAMDLEADLGIDSVKRMEILAGFRTDHPNVPSRELGRARTLTAIAALLAAPGASPAESGRPIAASQPQPLTARPKTTSKPPTVPRGANGAQAAPVSQALLHPLPPVGNAREHPLKGAVVLVVGGGDGLAAALVHELAARGGSVAVTAEPLSNARAIGNGAANGPAGALIVPELDRIERESGRIGAAIVLAPCASRAAPHDDFSIAKGFIALLQSMVPRLQGGANGRPCGRLLAVTQLDGKFGLAGVDARECETGAIYAALKTVRHECADLLLQSVDLSSDFSQQEAAAQIVAELTADQFGTVDVALTPEARSCIEFVPAPAVKPRRIGVEGLGSRAVVLFSGGARGIGGLCAEALARETRARMIIIGRTALTPADPAWAAQATGRDLRSRGMDHLRETGFDPLPRAVEAVCRSVEAEREVRQVVAHLRAWSPSIEYLVVDVGDRIALAQKVAEATARLGPVTEIVHGAGVLADRRLEDVRPDDIDRVFRPKLGGLRNLLNAVDRNRLKRIALFSSTAACFGNEGQVVYAMANEVLNKYTFSLARELPARVLALDWGPWQAGMVTSAIADRFLARGIRLLSGQAGCAAFLNVFLEDAPGAYQFVIGDGPHFPFQVVEASTLPEVSIHGTA
jgi:acyl transferase domain-containing protein/NAD(P)-dependent dehydrogenase (short-subunit alcohol dehydrogenase family)